MGLCCFGEWQLWFEFDCEVVCVEEFDCFWQCFGMLCEFLFCQWDGGVVGEGVDFEGCGIWFVYDCCDLVLVGDECEGGFDGFVCVGVVEYYGDGGGGGFLYVFQQVVVICYGDCVEFMELVVVCWVCGGDDGCFLCDSELYCCLVDGFGFGVYQQYVVGGYVQ